MQVMTVTIKFAFFNPGDQMEDHVFIIACQVQKESLSAICKFCKCI